MRGGTRPGRGRAAGAEVSAARPAPRLETADGKAPRRRACPLLLFSARGPVFLPSPSSRSPPGDPLRGVASIFFPDGENLAPFSATLKHRLPAKAGGLAQGHGDPGLGCEPLSWGPHKGSHLGQSQPRSPEDLPFSRPPGHSIRPTPSPDPAAGRLALGEDTGAGAH